MLSRDPWLSQGPNIYDFFLLIYNSFLSSCFVGHAHSDTTVSACVNLHV